MEQDNSDADEDSNGRRIEDPVSSTTTPAKVARSILNRAFQEMEFEGQQYLSTLGAIKQQLFNVIPENFEGSYEDIMETASGRMQRAMHTLQIQSSEIQHQTMKKLCPGLRFTKPLLPPSPAPVRLAVDVNHTDPEPVQLPLPSSPLSASIDSENLLTPPRAEHSETNRGLIEEQQEIEVAFASVSEVSPVSVPNDGNMNALLSTPIPQPTNTQVLLNKRKLQMSPTPAKHTKQARSEEEQADPENSDQNNYPLGLVKSPPQIAGPIKIFCPVCNMFVEANKFEDHKREHDTKSYCIRVGSTIAPHTSFNFPPPPASSFSSFSEMEVEEHRRSEQQDSSLAGIEQVDSDSASHASRHCRGESVLLLEDNSNNCKTSNTGPPAIADNVAITHSTTERPDINTSNNSKNGDSSKEPEQEANASSPIETLDKTAEDSPEGNCTVKIECAENEEFDSRISELPKNPLEVQTVDDEEPGPSTRENLIRAMSAGESDMEQEAGYGHDDDDEVVCVKDTFEELVDEVVAEFFKGEDQQKQHQIEVANREFSTHQNPAEDPKLKASCKVNVNRLDDNIEDELFFNTGIIALHQGSGSSASEIADGDNEDSARVNSKLLATATKRLLRVLGKDGKEVKQKNPVQAGRIKKRKMGPKSKVKRDSSSESELDDPDENEDYRQFLSGRNTGVTGRVGIEIVENHGPPNLTSIPDKIPTSVEDEILGSENSDDEARYKELLLRADTDDEIIASASADDEQDQEETTDQAHNKKRVPKVRTKKNSRRRQDWIISDVSDVDMSSSSEEESKSVRAGTGRKTPQQKSETQLQSNLSQPPPDKQKNIVYILNTGDSSSSDSEEMQRASTSRKRKKVQVVHSSTDSDPNEEIDEPENMSERETNFSPSAQVNEERRRSTSSSDRQMSDENGEDSSPISDIDPIDWDEQAALAFPRPILIKVEVQSEEDNNDGIEILEPIRRFDKIAPEPSASALVPEHTTPPKTGGRKDIRPIMPEELDDAETKKAKQEEDERIERIRRLAEQDKRVLEKELEQGPQSGFVLEGGPEGTQVEVHHSIANRLKPHQEQGITFMWRACFESRAQALDAAGGGCMLAHCMGLGKTVQVIALTNAILTNPVLKPKFKHVLVVLPKIVARNWLREGELWKEGIVSALHVPMHLLISVRRIRTAEETIAAFRQWQQIGGIALIHYDILPRLVPESLQVQQRLIEKDGQEGVDLYRRCLISPGPDIVVLDEGHTLKNNASKTCRIIASMETKRKIILSGTPIQNNLKEWYTMVGLLKPKLLGTLSQFTNRFVNPITNGQFSNSHEEDVDLMKQRTYVLNRKLEHLVHRVPASVLSNDLPPKKEFVISVKLTAKQAELYNEYLSNGIQQRKLFIDYNTMVKIIAHPLVLKELTTEEKRNNRTEKPCVDIEDCPNTWGCPEHEEYTRTQGRWFHNILNTPGVNFDSYEMSGKLVVLRDMLMLFKQSGEKTLVFSQFLSALNHIEGLLNEFCTNGAYNYFRIDGQTTMTKRNEYINTFNDPNKNADLLLLSTRTGSSGINLTAASRVILFDASWNPAQDQQAMFRTYRYGQERTVYIYRFVGWKTMEERVYNTQVVKLALASRIIDDKQIERHIAKNPEEKNLMYEPYPITLVPETAPLPPDRLQSILEQDELLAQLVQRCPTLVHNIVEHDSLLQDDVDLSEEQQKLAWESFNKETIEPEPATGGDGENIGDQQQKTKPRKPRGPRKKKLVLAHLPNVLTKKVYAKLTEKYGADGNEFEVHQNMYNLIGTGVKQSHAIAKDTNSTFSARVDAYRQFKNDRLRLLSFLNRLGQESTLVVNSTYPFIPELEESGSLIPGLDANGTAASAMDNSASGAETEGLPSLRIFRSTSRAAPEPAPRDPFIFL